MSQEKPAEDRMEFYQEEAAILAQGLTGLTPDHNERWVEQKRQNHLDNISNLHGVYYHGTYYHHGVGQPRKD